MKGGRGGERWQWSTRLMIQYAWAQALAPTLTDVVCYKVDVDDAEELTTLNGIEASFTRAAAASSACARAHARTHACYNLLGAHRARGSGGTRTHSCGTCTCTAPPQTLLFHVRFIALLCALLTTAHSLSASPVSRMYLPTAARIWCVAISLITHPSAQTVMYSRQSMPTFKCFRDGVEVAHTTGSDFGKLKDMIAKHTPSSSDGTSVQGNDTAAASTASPGAHHPSAAF